MPDFRHHLTDNGNCRIYFKRSDLLYAWQNEGSQGFKFYRCSRDGEPDYQVFGFTWSELPTFSVPTEPVAIVREFCDFMMSPAFASYWKKTHESIASDGFAERVAEMAAEWINGQRNDVIYKLTIKHPENFGRPVATAMTAALIMRLEGEERGSLAHRLCRDVGANLIEAMDYMPED